MRVFSTMTVQLLLASAFLIISSLIPTFAAAAKCEAQIDTELTGLDISKDSISKISSIDVYTGTGESNGGRLERIEGWISFNNCKGNLVLEFNPRCQASEKYTTYSCSIAGVKSY